MARLASAEVASALARERPFRRLQALDLDALNARTVLVDPPRAGLDAATCNLVSGFERVIYISCNPHMKRGRDSNEK